MRFILLSIFLVGCAHSQIVPFNASPAHRYPPTDPARVGIYRSTHPVTPFQEIGMITYRSGAYDLGLLYDQIRKDAAAYGADDVYDVKISKETHQEYEPEQVCEPVTICGADGSCTTENKCHTELVLQDASSYLISGSMIREIR